MTETLPLIGMDNTTALELIVLERAFADDCKCESVHRVIQCSIEVVARKFYCVKDFNICHSSYEWNLKEIATPNRYCADCHRHPSECWTITPI